MRPIIRPNGEIYCYVSVEDGSLKIKLNQGQYRNFEVRLDAKVIPQLRQLLTEAEFLKCL